MWENESKTREETAYLYPPSALSVKEEQTKREIPSAKEILKEQLEKKAVVRPEPLPKPSQQEKEDVNYLVLAQLVVCIAVVLFVVLMQKTNYAFYTEMGQEYQAALESGVDLSGENQLLKFTEQAMAQAKKVAVGLTDEQTVQGAGGWNPTQNEQEVPEGYSLEDYTLSEEPSLPLEQYTITSLYGTREHPITGQADFHSGLDLAAAEGTDIHAVLGGVVLQTGTSDSYGNYVKLLHSNNLVTTYNHMQQILVKQGQTVQKGQTVGTVGSTGVSTGPHLHLEFLLNGIYVDPSKGLKLD